VGKERIREEKKDRSGRRAGTGKAVEITQKCSIGVTWVDRTKKVAIRLKTLSQSAIREEKGETTSKKSSPKIKKILVQENGGGADCRSHVSNSVARVRKGSNDKKNAGVSYS